MKQPEGSGSRRPARPVVDILRGSNRTSYFFDNGRHFILFDGDPLIYECVHEPDPPPRRVAAFPRVGSGHMFGQQPYQIAQRLRQLDAEEKSKLDPDGNPIVIETSTPEERKAELKQLVRAKFQQAADDELMQSYAERPDNNEEVQAKVDAWRAQKEARRVEREEARAEWRASREQREWTM